VAVGRLGHPRAVARVGFVRFPSDVGRDRDLGDRLAHVRGEGRFGVLVVVARVNGCRLGDVVHDGGCGVEVKR